MVSADLDLKFVDFVSYDQTKALLSGIADKTGVSYIAKAENFTISGSFQQVQATRSILKQSVGQFNGTFSCDLTRKEAPGPAPERPLDKRLLNNEVEKQEDVNQNVPLKAEEDEANYSSERLANNNVNNSSPGSPEIQTFRIVVKTFPVFTKAYDKELRDIETKYHVEIPRKTEGEELSLKPKHPCSGDQYGEACNQFTALYRKFASNITREIFAVKSEKKIVHARQAISKVGKSFPILIEKSRDQSRWEMYGEASYIEKAFKTLKQDGMEIIRENELAVDKKGRGKVLKENDEAMDLDPPTTYSRYVKTFGKVLETYLGNLFFSLVQVIISTVVLNVISNLAKAGGGNQMS